MEAKHYNYIDIARGVAILLVIMVHTGQHVYGFDGLLKNVTAWGQMGVQLFFVTSALTLCISWNGRTTEKNKTLKFFIRRFFRIAPVYYLGICVYFILSWIDSTYLSGAFARNFNYSISRVVDNVFLMHGLSQKSNNNVVPGGWSIGAEFLFYFSFPLIMSISYRIGMVKSAVAMISLSFVWFAYSAIKHHGYVLNSYWYYNVLSQLPAFATGIVLCQLLYRNEVNINNKCLFAAIPMVLASIAILNSFREGVVVWANVFIASSAFALIIISLYKSKITIPFIEKIGVVSYSMYISHFIIVWFVVPYVSVETSAYVNSNVLFVIMYCMTVCVSYFISKVIYKSIEIPFINAGKYLIKKVSA